MKASILKFLLKRDNRSESSDKSAEKALKAFKKATSCNWYSSFLEEQNCNVDEIKTVAHFHEKVPCLSKQTVFATQGFDQLVNCSTRNIHSVMLSSGHSSSFSLGVITRNEHRKLASQTDLFLEIFFGIKKGGALLINASAMGVRAFTNHTCCDTGPRSDIVVQLLRQVAPHYRKTVITADPHLIKQIAEEACEAGIDWSKLNLWFISGGEWFPETLRSYVHGLMGKSASVPERGFWAAIYGLTELGYPIMFETPQLALHRSRLSFDQRTVSNLPVNRQCRCTTPFLFHHFTSGFYVETVETNEGIPELVFTTLAAQRAIPLVRYRTGDVGSLLPPDVFADTSFHLPVVAFWGRMNNYAGNSTPKISVTDIKELLFKDWSVASKITGYFTLKNLGNNVQLSIQLKKGCLLAEEEECGLNHQISLFYKAFVDVEAHDYYGFNHQMELDFERKFNHLIAE